MSLQLYDFWQDFQLLFGFLIGIMVITYPYMKTQVMRENIYKAFSEVPLFESIQTLKTLAIISSLLLFLDHWDRIWKVG